MKFPFDYHNISNYFEDTQEVKDLKDSLYIRSEIFQWGEYGWLTPEGFYCLTIDSATYITKFIFYPWNFKRKRYKRKIELFSYTPILTAQKSWQEHYEEAGGYFMALWGASWSNVAMTLHIPLTYNDLPTHGDYCSRCIYPSWCFVHDGKFYQLSYARREDNIAMYVDWPGESGDQSTRQTIPTTNGLEIIYQCMKDPIPFLMETML